LKIGFFNLLYSHRELRGGLGSHIDDLSRALVRRGHDVTVLTSGPPDESLEDGVRVVRLGRVEPYRSPRQLARPAFVLQRLRYLRRLERYVGRAGFDVVEAADGGFEQLPLLRRRHGALVTKLHGNFRQMHARSGPLAHLVAALERRCVRASDEIYSSAAGPADQAARDYRLPRERFAVIPCGVDLGALRLASRAEFERHHPDLAGRRLVVTSVGSSPGRKGARLFLRTARLCAREGVAFVLVGSTGALGEVERGPGVFVLPTLEKRFFHGLLAGADAVVFASQFETFSIATHEAMLLGRTVIASRWIPLEGEARDYPRLIDIARLDAECLSAAVRQALDVAPPPPDETTRRRLEAAYGIDHVAEATLALYRQASAVRNAARAPAASVHRPGAISR